MPAANITINAAAASLLNAAIDTTLQLGNQGVGGETTYSWVIVDQPPGAADALSSTTTANPTIHVRKEGGYVFRLTVNGTIVDQKKAVVRHLKSSESMPAARESFEGDATEGWHSIVAHGTAQTGARGWLARLDALLGDANLLVGTVQAGGLVAGQVLHVTAATEIKSGLPGAEFVLGFDKALATNGSAMAEHLFVLVSDVLGGGAPANGALVRARGKGLYGPVNHVGASIGDPVYLSDTGTISFTQGTYRRVIGHVAQVIGNNNWLLLDGGERSQVLATGIIAGASGALSFSSGIASVVHSGAGSYTVTMTEQHPLSHLLVQPQTTNKRIANVAFGGTPDVLLVKIYDDTWTLIDTDFIVTVLATVSSP